MSNHWHFILTSKLKESGMNPYLEFVKGMQAGVELARDLSASGQTAPIESDQKAPLKSSQRKQSN